MAGVLKEVCGQGHVRTAGVVFVWDAVCGFVWGIGCAVRYAM